MITRVGGNLSRLVRFTDLTARELESWQSLRIGNPKLDSPYFHPGFAEAVSRTGPDVQIAVTENLEGHVISLLPCQRYRDILRPVGWPGADFQGPILASGGRFEPLAILKGGVREYAFDHLLEACPDFEPWVETRRPSPYLDVSGGLSGYIGRASRSGKDNMGQARRRAKKAEEKYGTLRWTAQSTDATLLDRVIQLKRAQYAATGAKDYFADSGRRELLRILLGSTEPAFGGLLSAVFAGPHLIAAHFGLRAGHVLHWWFPVYDSPFAQFSPGWILLRELVISSPALGISRIDLGRGEDEYKRRAKTGEFMVSQGTVVRGKGRHILRHAQSSAVRVLKSSALAPKLVKIVHAARARSR